MPELFFHGRPLRRLIQRWRVVSQTGSRARIFEVPSWIQTMIRADRDWDDDDRQVWGYTGDASNLSLNTNFPSVAVFAGSREVHVRRIDYRMGKDDGTFLGGAECNILTPPDAYNPVQLNAGEFFPFLQTTPVAGISSPMSVPNARVIGGHQTALLSILIGGVLVNPAIGPRFVAIHDGGPAPFPGIPVTKTILDWNDPPLILPPFRVMAVQYLNPPAGGAAARIFVNLVLSERETA